MQVWNCSIAALQHCSIAALQHCSIAIALPQLLSHKTLSTMLSVEKLGQRKFIEPHHYDSLDVLKVSFSTRRHMILYMVHMHVHIFTYSVHTHTYIYIYNIAIRNHATQYCNGTSMYSVTFMVFLCFALDVQFLCQAAGRPIAQTPGHSLYARGPVSLWHLVSGCSGRHGHRISMDMADMMIWWQHFSNKHV